MKLQAIPTNIITGFLGVGKTTAIEHLLREKPPNERWAVLVNEFGEVGIDGSLFTGSTSEEGGVFVKEVPGGCMCCAAGLPMQIALNMLLGKAKPDRLLIEPTGLGHPEEVVRVLSSQYYREVLKLNATITMVDARKICDARYTNHPTFNQQLDIADVIIANKFDQYGRNDFSQLLDYLGKRHGSKVKPIYPTSFAKLDVSWLNGSTSVVCTRDIHNHEVPPENVLLKEDTVFGESDYFSVANEGEGFVSQGWVFKPDYTFNRQKLYTLLHGLKVERAKGVLITDHGIVGFNKVDDVLTEIALDDSMDSRIELIASNSAVFEGIEKSLLACALLA